MLTKTSNEWQAIFDAHDIANEIARHFSDVYQDEQARANLAFDEVEYPGGITTALPAPPFYFSEYGRKEFQKTGVIGRDTNEVLGSLGYSADAVRQMREKNILK